MNLKELIVHAPEHIKKTFIYRKYMKSSFIIHPHEDNNYLFILIKGSSEVYRQNSEGTMISLYIYKPYSCFGEVEIFNNNYKTLGVIAKTDCEAVAIHKESVYEWMRADFNFTFYMVKQLSSKLIKSSDVVTRLSFLTVKDRILYSIYAHYKIGDLDNLTKQTLSSEVCAPIRSLNRSIAQCIDENLIDFKDKKFTVISIEKLERHIENFF